jgi:hypothetical protein
LKITSAQAIYNEEDSTYQTKLCNFILRLPDDDSPVEIALDIILDSNGNFVTFKTTVVE